jgi:F0F1-type ATP synthase assembly protein I
LVSLVVNMVRILHWVLAAIGGGQEAGVQHLHFVVFLCLPKFNYRK